MCVVGYYCRLLLLAGLKSRVGIFISGTIGLQNLLYMNKTNGSDYSAANPFSLFLSLSAHIVTAPVCCF